MERLAPFRIGVIPPLSAESVPADADALRDELMALLPRPRLASLLIEMDSRIGFTGALVHAGGKVARSPELVRNIYACLIAEATNLGLVGMAEASGIPYDVLAWTAEQFPATRLLTGGWAPTMAPAVGT